MNSDLPGSASKDQLVQEAFYIEADLYNNGAYTHMLVVPCNDRYIVVSSNRHICTLVHTCNKIECWQQQHGGLDDDIVRRISAAIQGYIDGL